MQGGRLQAAYEIIHGDERQLPDVAAFIETLNNLRGHAIQEVRTFFDTSDISGDIIIARAPGRLDVMGGIADYSGSLVLELPIAEATLVALQKEDARRVRIVSLSEDPTRNTLFEMSLADFEGEDGAPITYDAARNYFERDPERHWAAYVAGVFLVLMRERGVRFAKGARLSSPRAYPPARE